MARMMHRATLRAILALLAAGALQPVLANSIAVTSPQQGRTDPRNCSLQEAIQSANLHQAIAIDSTNPDHFYSTGCSPGSGTDIIVLPEGILLQMSAVAGDAHNPMGPTATPIVFSNIVIEANGATLMPTAGAPAMRAFAVGAASINTPNGVISGTGKLTIRNAYIKGFHVNGGDGATGGGGGMGAGGAIYIDGSIGSGIAELTIENSTFDGNGAVGGNGSHYSNSGPGGGGGGLNGAGGIAEGEHSGVDLASGGGGGGGGSRGNGGANGGKTRTCVPVQPGCNGQWTSPAGGGGGGTVSDGAPAFSFGPGVERAGGFRCGGDGGDYLQDGHDAASSCPGGGGGGGGKPDQALVRLGGDGGNGSYGGGGGGGGFHQSDTSGFTFGRQGGRGGFGGGGGAGGQDDNGGDGGFGGGGGAGGDTPGAKGAYGGPGLHQGGGAGAGLGGAIFSHIANVVVRNSTFINNYVSHGVPEGGGWGGDAGGAIFAVDGTLAVHNTTVSGNQSTGTGAGIVVDRSLTDLVTSFALRNTIIANNGAQECMYFNGVSATGSGNLIMRNAGCPGVVVALDPQLGPLQSNMPGSTPTMAIDLSSPAYNAADAPTSLAEDQRGVSRPQATGFDIGAYEFVKPLADLAIATTTLGEPHPGERFSYLIEVENQGPTDAQNVKITDVLPNGTVFSSITGSGNFNCTGTGPVVCSKQTMTRGEIDALTLTVSIPLSIVKGTTTKNSASITSTIPDPNLANNAASVSAVLQ